jgi:hypothetical protein
MKVKQACNSEVNQLSVAATSTASTFSSTERSLQRFKVKRRSPLPRTRQDLVLPQEFMTTTDGRQFVLIDDGAADRILVLGTENQLKRHVDNSFIASCNC